MALEPIAFVGLGKLGLPVAANLAAAGFPLRVYNRTAAKADPLVERGATRAARPAETVTPGGVLVTLLWDDASVEQVVRSDDLLARLGDGVHVSMSTLSPGGSKALAALHAAHGSSFVEAPIFGGADAAATRQLWIPVAGPAAAKARVKPLLEAMGAQGVYDFGEAIGAATTVKLVGNFLILSAAASLREGLGLADKSGVDAKAVLEMMTETLFASSVYRHHGRIVIEGSTRLARSAIPEKDLGLFAAMAESTCTSATLARTLLEMRKGAG